MSRILSIIAAFALFAPAAYTAYPQADADRRLGRY